MACTPFLAGLIAGVLLGAIPAPRIAAATAAAVSIPPPASGRPVSVPEGILPADVLARVELLRENVEQIRRFTGRPPAPAPLLRAGGAMPREVYSQALNLERRSNRLAFEQSRVTRPEGIPLRRDARPADVFAVVNRSLEAILTVKETLGIEEVIVEKVQPDGTSPTQVFNTIVLAGAEVNELLEHQTSPSHVFQQVTEAVHQAAALQASTPGAAPMPDEPPFEPNKTPRDVYLRLQECFSLLQEIAAQRGQGTLRLKVSEEQAATAKPNDVSDLASLVVETLVHLHSLEPDSAEPPHAHYPGRKFPAHVFQRAGLLEAILVDLAAQSPQAPAPGPTTG